MNVRPDDRVHDGQVLSVEVWHQAWLSKYENRRKIEYKVEGKVILYCYNWVLQLNIFQENQAKFILLYLNIYNKC